MTVNRLPARAGLGFQYQPTPSLDYIPQWWKTALIVILAALVAYKLFFSKATRNRRQMIGQARARYKAQLARIKAT